MARRQPKVISYILRTVHASQVSDSEVGDSEGGDEVSDTEIGITGPYKHVSHHGGDGMSASLRFWHI